MSSPFTRRHALKLMGGALLAAGPALELAADASAGIGWCRADPHISVGGRETNIYVERDASMPNITTGPIQLAITVPVGSSPRLLSSDSGFGYGYDITFIEAANLSDGAIRIQCFVPAPDNSLLVQLVSVPVDPEYKPQSKRSTTNATFNMLTHI